MSKYEKLWQYISQRNQENLTMTYDEIATVLGFAMDHSFLTYKKELTEYGFVVGKISMKNGTVEFVKIHN